MYHSFRHIGCWYNRQRSEENRWFYSTHSPRRLVPVDLLTPIWNLLQTLDLAKLYHNVEPDILEPDYSKRTLNVIFYVFSTTLLPFLLQLKG